MRKALLLAAVLVALSISASADAQCLLTFQTESIPLFVVGQPTHIQLEGVSGTEPYEFEVVDGALPEGIHMNKNGKFSGVARQEEDLVVYIRLTDAAGCSLVQAFAARSGSLP